MDDLVKVNINVDGKNHEAIVLMNFSLNDEEYCLYAISDGNGKFNIYYGRIVDNILVPDNMASTNSELAALVASKIANTLKK